MKARYSGLAFLAELLVNVVVFSISCAILVGVFSGAFTLAQSTSENNLAMAELYSLTEIVKAEGADALPSAGKGRNGCLWIAYTEDWQKATTAAAYTVKIELTPTEKPGGTLTHILAVAYNKAGKQLCSLKTAGYQQKKGGVGDE